MTWHSQPDGFPLPIRKIIKYSNKLTTDLSTQKTWIKGLLDNELTTSRPKLSLLHKLGIQLISVIQQFHSAVQLAFDDTGIWSFDGKGSLGHITHWNGTIKRSKVAHKLFRKVTLKDRMEMVEVW